MFDDRHLSQISDAIASLSSPRLTETYNFGRYRLISLLNTRQDLSDFRGYYSKG